MSSNAELFRQIIERGFNGGDLTVADEVCPPTYVEHEYLSPVGLSGPETLKEHIRQFRKALQGFVLTIEDCVESGDKVWIHMLCKGVYAPTGAQITMDVVDICRFEHGKLVEHWGVPDRFAMWHQLGLLPPLPT